MNFELYHVSYDPVKHFRPRIPRRKLLFEDDKTPRICASDSLESCINAKPSQALPITLMLDHGYPVFLYLYTLEVPCKDVLTPDIVHDVYKVSDALDNQEYWILSEPVRVTEHILKIKDVRTTYLPAWDYPTADQVFFSEVYELPEYAIQSILSSEVKRTGKTTDDILVNLASYSDFYESLNDLIDSLSTKEVAS